VSAYLDVVAAALPDRHAVVGKIRNGQEYPIPPLLARLELDAQLFDLLSSGAVGFLDLRRILALPLRARDFVSGGVLLTLQALNLRQEPAPLRFEHRQFLEFAGEVGPARLQPLANGL
jgi:hypothetical protein